LAGRVKGGGETLRRNLGRGGGGNYERENRENTLRWEGWGLESAGSGTKLTKWEGREKKRGDKRGGPPEKNNIDGVEWVQYGGGGGTSGENPYQRDPGGKKYG